jgi:hypothetical protein
VHILTHLAPLVHAAFSNWQGSGGGGARRVLGVGIFYFLFFMLFLVYLLILMILII